MKVDVDVGARLQVWTVRDSEQVAEAMRARIVTRTRDESTGADGKPFAPFARSKSKGVDRGPVRLTRSGALLDTLKTRATPARATVNATQKYAWLQNRLREFMGFSDDIEDIWKAVVLPAIEKHMAAANSTRTIANKRRDGD